MARVFQGKIASPGDHIEADLEALGQFEHDKAPLRTHLEHYARDFAHALAPQQGPKTVRQPTRIIDLFMDFVCWDTAVRRLEEITRGMANSAFRQWQRRNVGDRIESEIKTALKQFFQCLAAVHAARRA